MNAASGSTGTTDRDWSFASFLKQKRPDFSGLFSCARVRPPLGAEADLAASGCPLPSIFWAFSFDQPVSAWPENVLTPAE